MVPLIFTPDWRSAVMYKFSSAIYITTASLCHSQFTLDKCMPARPRHAEPGLWRPSLQFCKVHSSPLLIAPSLHIAPAQAGRSTCCQLLRPLCCAARQSLSWPAPPHQSLCSPVSAAHQAELGQQVPVLWLVPGAGSAVVFRPTGFLPSACRTACIFTQQPNHHRSPPIPTATNGQWSPSQPSRGATQPLNHPARHPVHPTMHAATHQSIASHPACSHPPVQRIPPCRQPPTSS